MATLAKLLVALGIDARDYERGLDEAESRTESFTSKLTSGFSKIGGFMGGAMLSGVTALGGGIAALGGSGLMLNNSLEQTTAKLNAFTKDGAKSAQILEMIRERAAKTPFEFDEMASSASALLPVSKMSGIALDQLMEKAEILAASNPMEGLEGAAFSLKEAASGDFTSIIERFNLSRSTLNRLKEEGVPALDAIQIAMQEMGLDTDLVTSLAETAGGRWSTFKDTIQGVASTITKPIFDKISSGLADVNKLFEANKPQLEAFGNILAGKVSTAIDWLANTAIPKLVDGWSSLQTSIETIKTDFDNFVAASQPIIDIISANLEPIIVGLAAILIAVLVPALYASATAIGANMIAAAPVIAILLAIGAGAALLYKAWTENWGGIQEKTQAVIDFVTPYFNQLVEWFQTNIPIAIKALSDFWTNTLVPALQTAWNFFQTKILPVLRIVVSDGLEVMQNVVRLLGEIWTNILVPALQLAYKWFNDNIKPILVEVGEYLSGPMSEAGSGAAKVFDSISNAVKGVFEWLGKGLSKLHDWIGTLDNFHIPSILEQRSPSELEQSILDVGEAIQNTTKSVPALSNALNDIVNPLRTATNTMSTSLADTMAQANTQANMKHRMGIGLNALKQEALGAFTTPTVKTPNVTPGSGANGSGSGEMTIVNQFILDGKQITEHVIPITLDAVKAGIQQARQAKGI